MFSEPKPMQKLLDRIGETVKENELPETLEAYKIRESVVMNLDEAVKFFGIDFKPSFFRWRK